MADDGGPFGSPLVGEDTLLEQPQIAGVLNVEDARVLERLAPLPPAAHYSHPGHAAIARTIATVIADGALPGLAVVCAALQDDPDFAAIGGRSYLNKVYLLGRLDLPSMRLLGARITANWRRRQRRELAAELAEAPDDEAAAAVVQRLAALDAAGTDKPSFPITIAADLAGRAIPERAWVVPGWIPLRQCTILSGPGGTGKSLLSLQLQAACAVGAPWLGLPAERVRSLAVYSEDADDELHLRMSQVAASMDMSMSDFGEMAWRSAILDPHEMVEEDGRGGLRTTAYFHWIVAAAKAFKARLLILDSAANVFGGNEIVRRHVRQFLTALNRLAVEIDGAVILLSHPSASGKADKSGNSGSTHWGNGVRSRLYLAQDDSPDADPDTRILTRTKANYGRSGDSMRLQWRDGVFHALDEPGALDRSAIASRADRVFMTLLEATYAAGQRVSPSPTANNYAPTVFGKHPGREGLGKAAFDAALYRLQQRGAVVTETYGRPSEPRHRLRPA